MTKKTYKLIEQLRELGFTFEEANDLRRIEKTLRRWFEYECGTENERGTSFCIEREGGTDDGKPFMRTQFMAGKNWIDRKSPVPDREKGARLRLAKIMEAHPTLVPFVQTDCRGAALYILRKDDVKGENLDSIYNRGLCVCE